MINSHSRRKRPLYGKDSGSIWNQVAELPSVVPVVDEDRLRRRKCHRCRTSTRAALPPGVPAGAFGPRLRAILGVLAGGYRLGERPFRRLVFDLLGLKITTGLIAWLKRRGAEELEAPSRETPSVCPHRRWK